MGKDKMKQQMEKYINRIKLYFYKKKRFNQFLNDFLNFKNSIKNDRFKVSQEDLFPCFSDNSKEHAFDTHYIYHPAWAAEIVSKIKPATHIDISSTLSFSTIISAFVKTIYYDYRPANLNLNNFESLSADLTKLHFKDNSIDSLSCMHVIEHIGLGRYGDPINAEADLAAFKELQRVVSLGGNLIFVTPVGKPKVAFNAHRIYSFEQITSYFDKMELLEFSLIPDNAAEVGIIRNASSKIVKEQNYGCGCFWFKKIQGS
jgi:hypothetical protein